MNVRLLRRVQRWVLEEPKRLRTARQKAKATAERIEHFIEEGV